MYASIRLTPFVFLTFDMEYDKVLFCFGILFINLATFVRGASISKEILLKIDKR